MKKITSSILLALVLFSTTGCVSDTLALISPEKNDVVATNDTISTKSNLYQKIGNKTENKIEGFVDKFFNKL